MGRLCPAVAVALLVAWPASSSAEEELRIALLAGVDQVELLGVDLAVFDGESGDRLVSWTGPREVRLKAGPASTVVVPGLSAPLKSAHPEANPRRVLVEAVDGIRVSGGLYLGRIEVVPEGPDRLLVINRLPLETYLLGIIGNEMNPNWPIEALKAQAVAARTYAMQRRMMMRAANRRYDLESTVLSQVYKGAERIGPSVIQAVRATRGLVMSYQYDLVEALFHSTCGGETVAAHQEFSHSVPYLVNRSCNWCQESARHRWQLSVPLKELSDKLLAARLTTGTLRKLDRGPGAGEIAVLEAAKQRSLRPRDLRAAMGYSNLYSNRFTAQTKGSRVEFSGQGFGHGVGMCQWGARGMALDGYDFREILQHYYVGVELKPLY